jgi:hypothetical protein
MTYDEMISTVFATPGAYTWPFGSTTLGEVDAMSDAQLRRLGWPRLRDQAVAVDEVFAEYKGRYLALSAVVDCCVGPKALDELARLEKTLVWIKGLQRRLRTLLCEAPQPRQVQRN